MIVLTNSLHAIGHGHSREGRTMDEMQSYLFREGNCAYAHQFMGAHPCKGGYDFAVWAPDAEFCDELVCESLDGS